jgi:hypothetical protein
MPIRLWCTLLLHFFSYCNSFIIINTKSFTTFSIFVIHFEENFLLHFYEKNIFSSSISCSLSHSYFFSLAFLRKSSSHCFVFLLCLINFISVLDLYLNFIRFSCDSRSNFATNSVWSRDISSVVFDNFRFKFDTNFLSIYVSISCLCFDCLVLLLQWCAYVCVHLIWFQIVSLASWKTGLCVFMFSWLALEV